MLTQLGAYWALIGIDLGLLGGPFSDPKVGSSGGTARTSSGTACELENSKNSIFEAIRQWYHQTRWWYHPMTVCQAVVPPD